MRLLSDFRDWYDHAFDNSASDAPLLFRGMYRGMTRFVALGELEKTYGTPRWGIYGLEHDDMQDDDAVITYFNESHASEGKILTTYYEGSIANPMGVWMKYHYESRARSVRLLNVGGLVLWYAMESTHDWRSNVGDVTIWECEAVAEYNDDILQYYPLHAIDFIETFDGWKAVDFNVSPSTKHSPLQNYLSADEVVAAIQNAATENSLTVQFGEHDKWKAELKTEW